MRRIKKIANSIFLYLNYLILLIKGEEIIYLVKKDDSKYVAEHAKESLNFQLTLMIAYVISFFLIFLLIGIALFVILHIFRLVVCIIATIKANEGKMYRYPFTLRLVK